ncbi:MAG: energy transducer TonB [Proteobacteria bacterium]|jgi:biopolymer transport protein ExbB|nr:energy transducer TonB [Pseudomonadota bacterium]
MTCDSMPKSATILLLVMGLALGSASVSAQQESTEQESAPQERVQQLDIQALLSTASNMTASDKRAEQQRESRFAGDRDARQGELTSMRNERTRQERISDQLDAQFETNAVLLEELQSELQRELGDLQELFGVIQQTASEAQEDYRTSYISVHYPERAETLRRMVEKMASLTELISIDEIEELWFHLQNDMIEQGKVVRFSAPVTFKTGESMNELGETIDLFATEDREVTRIGVFNTVTGNDIATYDNERGLVLLDRQMPGPYTGFSNDLQQASGVTSFLLDPTKGVLLSALVREPTLFEKVQEGKAVGYVIIGLGLIGMVIVLFRIFVLSGVQAKVSRQVRNIDKPLSSNPLGRVVKVYHDNPAIDPESMELKLSEAILKETPKLNSMLMFVRIIATVAPLLGLLGTVTGMIQTFQAITLYGAGDPQMMAGGISQALVTTVLGLVVALPTLFLHWLASGRAKRVEQILEETTAGLVAQQIESQKQPANI